MEIKKVVIDAKAGSEKLELTVGVIEDGSAAASGLAARIAQAWLTCVVARRCDRNCCSEASRSSPPSFPTGEAQAPSSQA